MTPPRAQVGWYNPRGEAEGILHLDCPLHMRVRGAGPPEEPEPEFLAREEKFLMELAEKVSPNRHTGEGNARIMSRHRRGDGPHR